MSYRALTGPNAAALGLSIATLMLAGTPDYTWAESMAKEAKSDVTDAWVTAKARIALFGDDRVKGRRISVETKDGTVILRGKVDSEQAKMTAAETVNGVEHVKGVRNELQVVAPADRRQIDTDDKAITNMVQQWLKADPQLKSAKINARVDSGIVTLTGEVTSLMTSSYASEVLSDVPGVRVVRNDLSYMLPRTSMGQVPAGQGK